MSKCPPDAYCVWEAFRALPLQKAAGRRPSIHCFKQPKRSPHSHPPLKRGLTRPNSLIVTRFLDICRAEYPGPGNGVYQFYLASLGWVPNMPSPPFTEVVLRFLFELCSRMSCGLGYQVWVRIAFFFVYTRSAPFPHPLNPWTLSYSTSRKKRRSLLCCWSNS